MRPSRLALLGLLILKTKGKLSAFLWSKGVVMDFSMVWYLMKKDEDHVLEFFGETVLVDDFSANYMRGAIVDYDDGLNDSGFKIKNPNAKQSCGCGNSFEVFENEIS